jgi:hypothetical protein
MFVAWPAQLTHPAPFDPQAPAAVPPTQVPFEQHPEWHGWLALQEVVQVVPLQA